MANNHDRKHIAMDVQDLFNWRVGASTSHVLGDDELITDNEESSDHMFAAIHAKTDFHKSVIRPQSDRKESLLTRALQTPIVEAIKVDDHGATDMARRRSTMSNASATSTADLTSDGGLTSPARTNTPSPPFPSTTTYMNFAPYTIGPKPVNAVATPMVKQESTLAHTDRTSAITQPDPAVEALVKKRCISFACGGQKPKDTKQIPQAAPAAKVQAEPSKRCTIKFACPFKPSQEKTTEKPAQPKSTAVTLPVVKVTTPSKPELQRRTSRSPSMTRKRGLVPSPLPKSHRDPTSTVRRASRSPAPTRARKPKYIVADELSLLSSEATRFHEFASEEPQEDDWISRDASHDKVKLTINDTLKKENAIRQLGKEAEEEALEEEEEVIDDSDEEEEEEEDIEDIEDEEDDERTLDGSDDEIEDASDGNETDNEAGFADSDDESDAGGDYQFWTPGKSILAQDGTTLRPSARRTASESSIDSLKHMSPIAQANGVTSSRMKPSRKIRVRPGTPDLPDSTDFVCGTLDEDRPLEEAYVSCMEARKREKHHIIPQDIDPSFPTSDPEDNDDDEIIDAANESEENIWMTGKFEDSEEDDMRSRRRASRWSPGHSPKRLQSPPPPKRHSSPAPTKGRHRSPPPRRLFGGHSPKRMRSPPPARAIRSPPASPTAIRAGIAFAPLGQRPGLTHTKSLPRRPNLFCQVYRASRLSTVNTTDGDETGDRHTRGAIDIVKGLEQKRQRRKEKFFLKQCNRARKGQQSERRPQPGKGAERMRDIGLHMAGKVEYRNGKAQYVLSV